MITLSDALFSLVPNAKWVLRGDVIEWLDTQIQQPTKQQIDSEMLRLQTEYINQKYAQIGRAHV